MRMGSTLKYSPSAFLFAERCIYHLLTLNSRLYKLWLRPLNHCPEWDVRQVLPIQGNFFIETTSAAFYSQIPHTSSGCRYSTTRRRYFCRALHLPPSNSKFMVLRGVMCIDKLKWVNIPCIITHHNPLYLISTHIFFQLENNNFLWGGVNVINFYYICGALWRHSVLSP